MKLGIQALTEAHTSQNSAAVIVTIPFSKRNVTSRVVFLVKHRHMLNNLSDLITTRLEWRIPTRLWIYNLERSLCVTREWSFAKQEMAFEGLPRINFLDVGTMSSTRYMIVG
jgi:hypothetical protein